MEKNVFIKCFTDQNNFKVINITYIFQEKLLLAVDL